MKSFDNLLWSLRRQYPEYPSTFSTCQRCGNNPARGGGACASCIESDIAEISTPLLAAKLRGAIHNQASVISDIRDKLDEEQE